MQLHSAEHLDNEIALHGKLLRQSPGGVDSRALAVRALRSLNRQTSHVAQRSSHFLRDTLRLRCTVAVVFSLHIALEDMISQVSNVLANLVIRAWLDDETVFGAGAQMHFANCDTATANF